jgi:nucleoside-diphosphate-sugar epimerase
MNINRRSFIEASVAAGCASLAGVPALSSKPESAKPLRILILGGTGFIGPHQVNCALQKGHTITLFNRGKTNTHLFPGVEKLRGDRNNDLTALEGSRKWDVVIDNSASIPRWVRQSAGLLNGRTSQYIYVSSLSVYCEASTTGIDETGPVCKLEDPTVEKVTGATYGGMKVLCEEETRKAFPENHTVVRPTLIVGPGDTTDRFTYWPVRINRGGEVLAPGTPEDPVQIIDARDLAEWMIRLSENRVFGTFNASSRPLGMAEMLYGIKASTSKHSWFTWIPASFLEKNEVHPWSDMPAWFPPIGEYKGFSQFSVKKALEAGLTFRPLAKTAKETIEWFRGLPEERQKNLKAGLSYQREQEVLKLWHQNNK